MPEVNSHDGDQFPVHSHERAPGTRDTGVLGVSVNTPRVMKGYEGVSLTPLKMNIK